MLSSPRDMKLVTFVILVFLFNVLQFTFGKSQGSCQETFNQTKGEIITPGFPDQIAFNTTCLFTISVEPDGSLIKLTFKNVSLPNESIIVLDGGLFSFIIGRQELQSRVIFTRWAKKNPILVVIPRNVSTIQGYKGLHILYERISNDVCRHNYQTQSGRKGFLTSPGYFGSYNFNETCEYFIESFGSKRVMVGFAELLLAPADYIVFYDGNDGSFLARNNGTPNFTKSVTSNSASIRVVFRSEDNSTSSLRRFVLYYREIPKDLCLEQYYGESGKLSSANKTCVFIIEIPKGKIELKFENLRVPYNDSIIVIEKREQFFVNTTTKVSYIIPSDSGQVKYIISEREESTLEVKFNSSAKFDLTFRQFKLVICREIYSGVSGNLSSANKSCTYVIRIPGRAAKIELKFEDLFIPPNDRIVVIQNPLWYLEKILYLMPSDSGRVKFIVSDIISDRLEIKFNSSATFNLTFKEFKNAYSINLYGTRGILTSPHYPQSYPDNIVVTYHVQVPDGHVKLNFTELIFASPNQQFYHDSLGVYDGMNTSALFLARYRNKTINGLPVVISSSNSMTIVFASSNSNQEQSTFRFRAIFTGETQVRYCKPLNMSGGNAYAARNLTLPGWRTTYYCTADYINKDRPYSKLGVQRECGFNGSWIPGALLHCARRCPHPDQSLKVNSSLSWWPSSSSFHMYDGLMFVFFCSNFTEQLIGNKVLVCTAYGNYSSPVPTCKRRPVKNNKDNSSSGIKPWVYSVSVGGVGLIISIVLAVLKVFFGAFTCCTNTNKNDNIELEQVNSNVNNADTNILSNPNV